MPRRRVDHWKLSSDRWLTSVAASLGITRVAMVTGLDRTGIPVACAIRPGGHVLQVTNGKGLTVKAATYSAVMEAAELFAAEHPALSGWHWDVSGEARSPEPHRAFVVGRDLGSGAPASVEASTVFCPLASGPLLGAADSRWTSNAMGAGRTAVQALTHALLEAIERDQLARSLSGGWTEAFIARAGLDPSWLRRHAPGAFAVAAQLSAAGFEVHPFDATPAEDSAGLPVAAVLLFDRERGPVPMSAGYACREGADAALVAAMLEAAQTRLTDIHGAREDVDRMAPEEVETLWRWCRAHRAAHVPPWTRTPALDRVVGRLARSGRRAVVAVPLHTGIEGLNVVKVVAPALLVSELL